MRPNAGSCGPRGQSQAQATRGEAFHQSVREIIGRLIEGRLIELGHYSAMLRRRAQNLNRCFITYNTVKHAGPTRRERVEHTVKQT